MTMENSTGTKIKNGKEKVIPASLIRDRTYHLGKSHRNVHEFKPVNLVARTLPPHSSLIKRSELVKTLPELASFCQEYYLPALFAAYLTPDLAPEEAICSGKRAAYFPGQKVTLDLRELGWSRKNQENNLQEFVVDAKGTGIRLKHSEHLDSEIVRKFIADFLIPGRFRTKNLEEELVFSRNRYLQFETTEGAQKLEAGNNSLESSDNFAKNGFKIAPHLCRIAYPMEIQKLVAELDQDAVMEIFLAQEKRLMPSFVRGTYFEHNDNHQELVRLISSDERTLKNLAPIIVEDMAHYFENLALTTKNRKSNSDSKSKYYWEGLGDLSRLLDHPGNMYEKPGAWYIAKDLVFAGTGLYFVDLEGALTHWEASSREKLRVQHYIYLTALLKDFFRVLTHFRIAVAGERDQFRKSRIEKESREMLMGRLNQSGYLELRTTPRSLELTLNYAHLPPEKYRIPQERLPLVTE